MKSMIIATHKEKGDRLSLCSLAGRYWLAPLPYLTFHVTIFPDVFVHEIFCERVYVSRDGTGIDPEEYRWTWEDA